jgi:putative tryptophan/tyrosine transport system substrate-binding protein
MQFCLMGDLMKFDRWQRREFITLIGSVAAVWPLAARAQHSERMRRIGVLTNWAADDTEGQARLAAFAQALKQLGWSDGRDLQIDTRWATADDIRRHAAELAALAPDVLVAATGSATVAPLLQATRTLPIVRDCHRPGRRLFRREPGTTRVVMRPGSCITNAA